MLRRRLAAYRSLIGEKLLAAFQEESPPRHVAGTFAFGLFFASLPNFGTALVLFAALAYYVERASKLAFVAAIVVMNPPVKWGIYLASIWLGTRLLGPAEGASLSMPSLSLSPTVGPAVLFRLFVGNLLISVVVGAVGYVLALRFVRELRRRDIEIRERLPLEGT